jgi:hypothetical protein
MLWLDAHKPEEKIIPPEIQAKLDAGNEFGDQAMGIFGKYVETTTFREDGRLHFAAMIEKTNTLLASGEPIICEAAFTWYGNFCAADILKKEENGYVLYEVKNAFETRKEFIADLGFQRLLLKKCGVPLLASKLVLRGDAPLDTSSDSSPVFTSNIEEIDIKTKTEKTSNNEKQEGQGCVEFINHNGFTYKIVDVSAAAKIMERTAEKRIFEFGKLKRKDAECPEICIGEHCEKPYRCWYYDFCRNSRDD